MIASVHVSIEISMEADEKRERRKDGGGGKRERKLHNSFGTLFRIHTHAHTHLNL